MFSISLFDIIIVVFPVPESQSVEFFQQFLYLLLILLLLILIVSKNSWPMARVHSSLITKRLSLMSQEVCQEIWLIVLFWTLKVLIIPYLPMHYLQKSCKDLKLFSQQYVMWKNSFMCTNNIFG